MLAVGLLSGCSLLVGATAPPGLRRGLDVPTRPGTVAAGPLGSPPLAPLGDGGYAFLGRHADGSPVTWDPCRPVHYAVRPTGQPSGGDRLLAWALGEVSASTGLRLVADGATDEAPDPRRSGFQKARYGDRWAPVLIAWSTPAESPSLADGVLGRAGPLPFGRAGRDDLRYVSGLAVFNGPALDQQLRTGDDNKARAVLLHELGHLVGLQHVTDPYQVMFDTNSYPLPAYHAGDLRGLALLGLGRCYRDY